MTATITLAKEQIAWIERSMLPSITTKVVPAPSMNKMAVSATVTMRLLTLKKPGRNVPITRTRPINTRTGAKARTCSRSVPDCLPGGV